MPPTRRQKYASRYKRVFIVFAARSHSGPRGPANGWSRAARPYVGCGGGPTRGGNGLRKGARTSWRRTLRTIKGGVSVRRANWSCIGAKGNWGSPPPREAPRADKSEV